MDGPEPESPEAGYIPPDPDEPQPIELWSTVGDVVPWGTPLLLLAWGAVILALAARGQIDDRLALIAWGASVTGRDALDSSWRLLASTFLHAGAAHVFFNSVSMLLFGPTVERLFARPAFWIVFAGGGAAASLASLAWRSARAAPGASLSVGASGAIFALAGAVLVAAWRLRRGLAVGRARALAAAMMFLIANGLVSGFSRVGTDNVGHAAGLVAGGALGAWLPLSPRLLGRPAGRVVRALGAIAALALGAALGIAVRNGLASG